MGNKIFNLFNIVDIHRFYVVLSRGLQGDSKQVLASILLSSSELFKIDLPGISCIIPALLTALESILPDKYDVNISVILVGGWT